MKMFMDLLRSSEFWIVVGQVVTEAMGAPVPEEAKVAGWVYVVARAVSKMAKFVFPNLGSPNGGWFKKDVPAPPVPPVVPAIIAAFLLCSASSASAQDVSLLDVGQRAHVTANAGAMVLTAGDDWSGATVGGTLLYNLHPQFSVFGGYDRGVPVNDVDQTLDVWRAVGSLKVHPNAFVGFGYASFDDQTEGALAQFLVFKPVMKRLDLTGVFAHIFSDGAADDFEYVKVAVNYHLIGKE